MGLDKTPMNQCDGGIELEYALVTFLWVTRPKSRKTKSSKYVVGPKPMSQTRKAPKTSSAEMMQCMQCGIIMFNYTAMG